MSMFKDKLDKEYWVEFSFDKILAGDLNFKAISKKLVIEEETVEVNDSTVSLPDNQNTDYRGIEIN